MDTVAAAAVMYFHLAKIADTTFRKGRTLDVDAHLVCGRCRSGRKGEEPRGTRKRPKETLRSEPTGPTFADLVRAQTWHKWRPAFNSPWYLHIQPPTNKNNQYIITFAESVSMCHCCADAGDHNRVEK
jgi:hypothetical protein